MACMERAVEWGMFVCLLTGLWLLLQPGVDSAHAMEWNPLWSAPTAFPKKTAIRKPPHPRFVEIELRELPRTLPEEDLCPVISAGEAASRQPELLPEDAVPAAVTDLSRSSSLSLEHSSGNFFQQAVVLGAGLYGVSLLYQVEQAVSEWGWMAWQWSRDAGFYGACALGLGVLGYGCVQGLKVAWAHQEQLELQSALVRFQSEWTQLAELQESSRADGNYLEALMVSFQKEKKLVSFLSQKLGSEPVVGLASRGSFAQQFGADRLDWVLMYRFLALLQAFYQGHFQEVRWIAHQISCDVDREPQLFLKEENRAGHLRAFLRALSEVRRTAAVLDETTFSLLQGGGAC
jgi:hypothetical protein